MIDRLRIAGLLSLRDAEVPLSPFTVLVGPNGAGKSNLFKILEAMRDFFGGGRSIPEALRSRGAGTNIGLSIDTSGPDFGYQLEIEPHGRVVREWFVSDAVQVFSRDREMLFGPDERPVGRVDPGPTLLSRNMPDEPRQTLTKWLAATLVFDFDARVLRNACQVEPTFALGPRGERLVAVLDSLKESHPDRFDRLQDALRRTIPGLKQIALPPVAPGMKGIVFLEKAGTVTAEAASDGTLLLLGLLTLVHLPNPPKVLCIEEPDRGVHPRRLADVVDYLSSLVDLGTQVLVTTHSPYFLDRFRDRKESVVIVDMTENGSRFRRLTDLGLSPKELEAPLGEIWFSGVLGGVPPA